MRTFAFPSTCVAVPALASVLAILGCSEPDRNPAPDHLSTSSTGPEGPGATVGSGGAGGTGASAGGTGGTGGQEPGLDVLFVGNSYVYVNDLPGHVRELAATSGEPPAIDVSKVAVGAATFESHWTDTGAQPAIAEGGHTHVVLQGQSQEPIFWPGSFQEYGKLLVDASVAAGATPVLYETWARKAGDAFYNDPASGGSPDAMQDALSGGYEALAMETGATLAPVGEAWRRTWTDHPEIELYVEDGSHPSGAGTYLTACVFYAVLTGKALPEASAVPEDVAAGDAQVLREMAAAAMAGQ